MVERIDHHGSHEGPAMRRQEGRETVTQTQAETPSDRLAAQADGCDERESAYAVGKRQLATPAGKRFARPYKGRVQIGRTER